MSSFRTIGANELQRRRQRGERLHVWNVLTDDYFTGEMIPDTRRVPVDRIVREVRQLDLDHDAEIIVYCSGYECPQSTAAAEKLTDLGFRNVWDFEGGLESWKEAELPVEELPVGEVSG